MKYQLIPNLKTDVLMCLARHKASEFEFLFRVPQTLKCHPNDDSEIHQGSCKQCVRVYHINMFKQYQETLRVFLDNEVDSMMASDYFF